MPKIQEETKAQRAERLKQQIPADVLAAARKQHCDVVALGDVQPVGAQDKAIVLRVYDANVEKPLWESESLRATKIVRERKKGNDPAKDLVAGAITFLEDRLGLTDMPTLKADIVERRAEKLAVPDSTTLSGLAELVYYHDNELLTDDKYQQCLEKAFGEELGGQLASPNEHDRRQAISKILDQSKPTKRRF